MAKLYSRNFKTSITAAELILKHRILSFNTQNSLFIFFEDIKNPELKNRRRTTAPKYIGQANYGPCIKFLSEAGILTKEYIDRKIKYNVNKKKLTEFLTVFSAQYRVQIQYYK